VDNVSLVTRKMGSYPLPDGKEVVLYGFSAFEWAAVQEAALAHYKRSIIKTWTDNLDLLPEDMRDSELRRVYREAEQITFRDLPKRKMKFPTMKNGQQLKDEKGNWLEHDEDVDYEQWWSSELLEGKVHCIWLSARKAPGQETWTKQYVADLIRESAAYELQNDQDSEEKRQVAIEEMAQTVGRLSQLSPELKNSSPPHEAGNNKPLTARQKRILERQKRTQAQTGL